ELAGFALVLDGEGALALWLGDGSRVARVSTATPVPAREWAYVAATYDAGAGTVRLVQRPLRTALLGLGNAAAEEQVELGPLADPGTPLLLAGYSDRDASGRPNVAGHYNGKLEAPRVFSAAL